MTANTIISISGKICSGKSYVADIISKQYGFPIASFGGYLKQYCKTNNLPFSRGALQSLGENFIKENPQQFLIDVLNFYKNEKEIIILEGIRHKVILQLIKKDNKNSISIFIDADKRTRYSRYKKRDSSKHITFNQFIAFDDHPVENEINSLKEYCDLTLNTTKDSSNILFEFLTRNLS